MTVVYLGEEPTGRRARNDKGIRSYTRSFLLETTSRFDDAYDVGSNASLPLIGSAHPSDASAWCIALDVECYEGWKSWRVTASYSSERAMAEDPTEDPAAISWDSEQFQTPLIEDNAGDAVVNSAGDPFDPPIMRDDSRRVATVVKNLATVPSWILSYQDAVNSDSFTIDGVSVTAGQAKMQRVTVSELQERNGTPFRVVTFQIHFQRDGWNFRPLDAGFRELDGTDRIQILNSGDSEPVNAPVPLNGSGAAIDNPTSATCVFLDFDGYDALAFSTLPLT